MCLLCANLNFIMLTPTNTDPESNVKLLIAISEEQYCRVEHMMFLRDSDNHADEIKQPCAEHRS